MKDTEINCNDFYGYENWETWSLGVLISNDEGLYNILRRKSSLYNETKVEEFIKEIFPDGIPDYETYGKEACYREVNWTEILEIVEGFQND